MVKLQKRFSRKVGNKKYHKYIIVIPPKAVEKAGFKAGQQLNLEAKKDKIIIIK